MYINTKKLFGKTSILIYFGKVDISPFMPFGFFTNWEYPFTIKTSPWVNRAFVLPFFAFNITRNK